jgi:hypothetical protein
LATLPLFVLIGILVGTNTFVHGRQDPPQYRVTVSVADNRGNPVTGLTAEDFIVTVGDVPRAAVSAQIDPRPISVVVIMDGTEASEVLQARFALVSVLKQLRRGTDVRVGMILGDEGASVPVMQDAQSSVAEHDRRASRFFQAPQTAPPFDTIGAAVAALQKEEGRRRVALLLSVNRRAAVAQNLEGLVASVRKADVTLAVVEGGRGRDQSVWLIHDNVGGIFVRGSDVAVLSSMGTRLAGALTSAYQVTFPATEAANLPMRVTVKGRDKLTVIAPSWAIR